MTKIKFLGAIKTVTGSCVLVESDNVKFLVDCGMFQGSEVEDRNWLDFEFNPSEINFVLLTHAHIDHSGLLPKLVKEGFRGEIFMTNKTAQIVEPLLLDAAKIQEFNGINGRRERENKDPLYNTSDVVQTLNQIRSVAYEEEVEVNSIRFIFENIGHVLGAASIHCRVGNKAISFSGDIGRLDHPFLEKFDSSRKFFSDYIIMESLYGGKSHEDRNAMIRKMYEEINSTFTRNGNVIIPAFSLQRTQEILYTLKKGYLDNSINKNTRVIIDSPLADKISTIYSHSIFSRNVSGKELFEFDNFRYVKSRQGPPRLLTPSIVIAGSGMCEGGRILNYLIKELPNKKSSIFIVGFQAEDTLGYKIINNYKKIRISKHKIKVKAKILEFYGFSAHADFSELSSWLHRFDKKTNKTVFLIHADEEDRDSFILKRKGDYNFYKPEWKEEIILN